MAMITKTSDEQSCTCSDGCCTLTRVGLPAAASLFRSLGDSSRLQILQHLMLGEHKVAELTDHLGLAQSTVSAHLQCLLGCEMVEARTIGRSSFYRVTANNELRNILSAAEKLLGKTGHAVELCPTYGLSKESSE